VKDRLAVAFDTGSLIYLDALGYLSEIEAIFRAVSERSP
jgi:hypothetical protein